MCSLRRSPAPTDRSCPSTSPNAHPCTRCAPCTSPAATRTDRPQRASAVRDPQLVLQRADAVRVVDAAVLGLLADDDLQQLVVLLRALPRQRHVQREVEAAQLVEARVD